MYQTKIYKDYYLDTEAEIRGGGSNDRLYLTNGKSIENFEKNEEIIGVEQIYAIMRNDTLNVTGKVGVERAGVGRGAQGVNTITLNRGSQVGVVEGIAGATAIFDFQEGMGENAVVHLEGAQLTTSLKVKNAGSRLILETEDYSDIGTLEADTGTLATTGNSTVKLKLAAGSAITTIEGGAAFDIDASAIAAADLSVKGGKGDDRLAVKFSDINNADDINLGGGTNTLAITDIDVDFRLAENAAKLDGLKGITCLEAAGTTLIIDQGDGYQPMQSYLHFAASNGGQLQITNGADDLFLHFRYGGGRADVTLAEDAEKLNILLEGASNSADVETNATTLTIDSSCVPVYAEGGNNTLNLSAPGATITLTGTHGLTLTLDNQGAANGFTLVAFDFEAILDVTASDGADEFGLFVNKDVDNARFIAAIHDFMSGVDTLFGGVAGSAENFLEGGYYQDFDAFLAAANEQFAANDDLVYYTAHIGGDLYIAQDVDDGGADAVIKLDGVQHISYTDIV